ncbi:MAG: 3-deoxy-D-manno-octulosonic acid transferase [Puniceicoccaceae bacterium]|nr:MAG: 3-deoxy-D-manno-octulosonic acid transferase [Puniceicoccaceae bacterium]
MWRRGGYRRGFLQRFGYVPSLPPPTPGTRRIWIHAVSVGEVLAAAALLQRLAARPGFEAVLTTTTSTGHRLARERLGGLTRAISYFPLDAWPCSARAWRRFQPHLSVLFEAELWPEHLHQARRRGVPVLLVNARLSDRSFARLRRVRPLVRGIWQSFHRILPASEMDLARFSELGAEPDRLELTGNIKLDVDPGPALRPPDKERLLRELGLHGGNGPLVLGSSTWPGEEEALLDLQQAAAKAGRPIRLLLVPRHAERRGELAHLLENRGLTAHFRSRGPAPEPVSVAVGDTTGELLRFTQLADLVFVGKSLPPNEGGQTPLEAAAWSKPLVFGPHMSNFRFIARGLVDAGAALVVGDAVDLRQESLLLLDDADRRRTMAEAAARWHAANRGALQRTEAAILAAAPRGSED